MVFQAIVVALLGAAMALRAGAAGKETAGPVILALDTVSIVPGSNVVLKLRGLKLDGALGLRISGAKAVVTSEVRETKKVDPPSGLEAKDVGDIRVEVGLVVPPELAPGDWEIRVVTPAGESPPRTLRVVDPAGRVEEREPNGGFREAQVVEAGQVVRGRIQPDKDVDVYRLKGRAGTRWAAEVFAARGGSLLDGVLSLYDARGRLLATQDETEDGNRDPRIECLLPADGDYFLVLLDAHDRGGDWHPYELSVSVTASP